MHALCTAPGRPAGCEVTSEGMYYMYVVPPLTLCPLPPAPRLPADVRVIKSVQAGRGGRVRDEKESAEVRCFLRWVKESRFLQHVQALN